MNLTFLKSMLPGIVMCLFSSWLCFLGEATAGDTIKIYYEENAQIELISPEGSRVLIDVFDPEALSAKPHSKDVLLTTHNHGDHRRLDFVSSFPGKKLDVKTGEIKLEDAVVRGIASAHNEGHAFRDENGTNYIFIIDMAGLRIAHFGDIGQDALTPEQLKALGRVDIAVMQFNNMFSEMSAANMKGFKLMDQLAPKLIIPTHVYEPTTAEVAAEKWIAFESYKKAISISIDNLPEETTIIFMGWNAGLIKLPYSDL